MIKDILPIPRFEIRALDDQGYRWCIVEVLNGVEHPVPNSIHTGKTKAQREADARNHEAGLINPLRHTQNIQINNSAS